MKLEGVLLYLSLTALLVNMFLLGQTSGRDVRLHDCDSVVEVTYAP